jgi:hypothetical protein
VQITCATCKPIVNSNSKFESREGNSKKIKQNEKRKRIGYSCAWAQIALSAHPTPIVARPNSAVGADTWAPPVRH